MNYKVGTRGSKLALRQTELVIERLKSAYPDDSFEIVVIKTTGDNNQKAALDTMGGKGVFTDKIEAALKNGDIHMAVHSMKDMPDTLDEGLVFAKAWKREDPRDVLILREAASLSELKSGSIIATGSKRRIYQIKKLRPDIEIVPIRGNIDTRLKKLREPLEDGRYIDGIVLAAAGLKRLGLENEISQYLSEKEMIPAPGQGTLAIELAEDSTELLEKINKLADEETDNITKLERAFLKKIGATCHDPIGAYAEVSAGKYTLNAVFGTPDLDKVAFASSSSDGSFEKLVDEVVCAIKEQLF